jgi:hypothetical protein
MSYEGEPILSWHSDHFPESINHSALILKREEHLYPFVKRPLQRMPSKLEPLQWKVASLVVTLHADKRTGETFKIWRSLETARAVSGKSEHRQMRIGIVALYKIG